MLTTFIWGSAFVAQSAGSEHLEPFAFNGIRMLIGAAVLAPVIAVRARRSAGRQTHDRKTLLRGGVLCGVLLFAASTVQQMGIEHTTAGKAGFITALYIVIVPLLGVFMKKKLPLRIWLGVVLALAGLYFLCITEDLSIGKGDLLVLCCAFFFSLHILVIDKYSPVTDGLKLSAIQFVTAGILSLPFMLIFESPSLADIRAAALPLLYTGVLSCGVAYTLQIIAQRDIAPEVASLLLSMESVFAVLTDWVVMSRGLSAREICGCVLMFCAVILAQLPSKALSRIKGDKA